MLLSVVQQNIGRLLPDSRHDQVRTNSAMLPARGRRHSASNRIVFNSHLPKIGLVEKRLKRRALQSGPQIDLGAIAVSESEFCPIILLRLNRSYNLHIHTLFKRRNRRWQATSPHFVPALQQLCTMCHGPFRDQAGRTRRNGTFQTSSDSIAIEALLPTYRA